MRAVVQRVEHAKVAVDRKVIGEIDEGFLVLLGVGHDDSKAEAVALAAKLVALRVFSDEEGLMNRSLTDVGGSVLLVSQFTLLGDVRKGRRPSFTAAAPPELAEPLVADVAAAIEAHGVPVATGQFGAKMEVSLVNDGPVTVILEAQDGRIV